MDTPTILSSAGVIATIIFGIASVYLFIRRRYPIRLHFVVGKEIALFDEIVRNLQELSVSYNGQPVAKNLVLIKGVLLNVGERDVTPSMVHKALEARLKNGFSWQTAKVVEASPDVSATLTITSPKVVTFDLGLLRRDEHLTLEAVAEVPLDEARPTDGHKQFLRDVIEFDHRIADAAPVKIQDMPAPIPKRRLFMAKLFTIYLALVLSLSVWAAYFLKIPELCYSMLGRDGQRRVVYARPRWDGKIDLVDQKTRTREQVTLSEFDALSAKPLIASVTIRGTVASRGLISGFVGALLFISALFYAPILYEWRRRRKLRRILGPERAGQ